MITFNLEGSVKVFVTTMSAPGSGTNDHVTLTVYGDAGNSGPLSLGEPDKGYFQPGQTDEFLVSYGVIPTPSYQISISDEVKLAKVHVTMYKAFNGSFPVC